MARAPLLQLVVEGVDFADEVAELRLKLGGACAFQQRFELE